MFKNCKDVKRRNFSAWKVKFYSIRNIYTQMFNSNRYIIIYNDPLKWYSKSITKFNSPQRSREHRNFLHAWKMKFLFLFDWRNWLFRIVVLIIMEGIVISSITKFNFTFIKNLKIQTRASFLFEKCNHSIRNIYTTECAHWVEPLLALVIMHSLCKTPRIRFSGCSQFSRLVRWGCRYRLAWISTARKTGRLISGAVLLPETLEREYFTAVISNSSSSATNDKTVSKRDRRNKWILLDRDSSDIDSDCCPTHK